LSDIRVTYTGLIAFIFGLAAIFTSMIFTLIVTRTLTPEEYGTWGIINSILVYIETIFVFLPNLLVYVIISVSGYLTITYFTDSKTKELFNSIISEIKKK